MTIKTPLSRLLLPAVVLTCMLSCPSDAFAESVLVRLLNDYRVLQAFTDSSTSMVVELGANESLGSVSYDVTVYDRPYKERWRLETGTSLFITIARSDQIALQFDGRCYVIVYDDMHEILDFEPAWTDPDTGQRICVRVVSVDGKRVLDTPLHRKLNE